MATAPAPLATLPAPDALARKRKLYEAMAARGIDGSPVQHWTQGAARLANALVGRMGIDDAASQERKARAETSRQADAAISALMGGGAAPASSPAAATPAMAPAAPVSASAPRGIRNNNPLNLEASPFTQRQPGFVGSDGRFGQFGSIGEGMAAADKLLTGYGNRGIDTIAGIINRWAPASDGNHVGNYAAFVANKAGVAPDAKINLADPAIRARILPAMAEF
jgi:hypothetical protein